MGLGAWGRRIGLRGLEWPFIKTHYSLIPVFVCGIAGNLLFCVYFGRMMMTHPEISFRPKSNPEPWNEYYSKQVKFVGSGRDYSLPSPAPKYR